MAKLNIYVPDELHDRLTAQRKQRVVATSEVCAAAIKAELDRYEFDIEPGRALANSQPRSPIEEALVASFGLKDAIVIPATAPRATDADRRDRLGKAAAAYLDSMICDGSVVGLAGGRQMWCMVRALARRNVRSLLVAVGLQQSDPHLLQAHPNTLVTLAFLAYSPHADAVIISSTPDESPWSEILYKSDGPILDEQHTPRVYHFVFASCSAYTEPGKLSRLLPKSARQTLHSLGAESEFAYTFFSATGQPLSALDLEVPSSIIPGDVLQKLSGRRDTRVVAVGGGDDKLAALRHAINAKLCNMVITDEMTARSLAAS